MVFDCRSENRGLNFHTMWQPDSHLVQLASQLHSYPQWQSSISDISIQTLVVNSRVFFLVNPIHCSFFNHSLVVGWSQLIHEEGRRFVARFPYVLGAPMMMTMID
jgi:hypothetical protein